MILPEGEQMLKLYENDFRYCENIMREHAKSFYSAFSKLPEKKANAIYAIYAFCRLADDAIDVHHDIHRLNQLEEELFLFMDGKIPDKPLWRALSVVCHMYPIELRYFEELILGQKGDLHFRQPSSQAELEDYCYFVASTVGLMLLPVLTDQPDVIQEQAKALGVAMQLTNILRDVGEDLKSDRIYLPMDVIKRTGYSEKELSEHMINQAFIDMWEFEAERAEKLYDEALTMMPYIDKECQLPLLLAIYYYQEILNAVRNENYQCFTKRSFVGTKRKYELYKAAKKGLAHLK
ncbi:phytoene/squalene synthase family protein [Listeria ilorinensis]|uniref:phytoene/squalene synthase family protein n=1 Tax=Listeria ilorinensis TaxID=2867439 RepID=UPI001EF560D5|nr:phytoene/squalene synthase family protein [Listeria ilorinensis]